MAKLCTFAFTLVSAAVSSASAAGPGNLDGYTFDDFKLAYDKSYGSEAEEGKVYNTGNGAWTLQDGQTVKGGFGHLGITVPDVYEACERFKAMGCVRMRFETHADPSCSADVGSTTLGSSGRATAVGSTPGSENSPPLRISVAPEGVSMVVAAGISLEFSGRNADELKPASEDAAR